ncbi:WhiB family transcriptional regulator [Streptomyces sp. NPDC059590]|uniref:WhiB family transcriptional regulator n=1 Tax=Streptomyces sp. NPDC059590 TaxID=3346877 RepID=UPI0036C39B1F
MIKLPDFIRTAPANCARPHIDPELWHSDDPNDRAHAMTICHGCPLFTACDTYATTNDLPGIWGGRTRAQRRGTRPTTDTPTQPRDEEWTDEDGVTRRPCGTPGAYYQHRRRAETCERCQTAYAARLEAERRAALAEEHAQGGTERGYYIHRRLGEPTCALCRAAMRRRTAARKTARAADKAAVLAAYQAPQDAPAVA